jgi:hypothetical protein
MGETLVEHARQTDPPAAVRAMQEAFAARQPAPVG